MYGSGVTVNAGQRTRHWAVGQKGAGYQVQGCCSDPGEDHGGSDQGRGGEVVPFWRSLEAGANRT